MKEQTLIEMQKRIEILGNAASRAMQELELLKTLSVGSMELIKLMPGYEDALAEMKKKQEQEPEKKLDLDE